MQDLLLYTARAIGGAGALPLRTAWGWLERTVVYERGLLRQTALAAMEAAASSPTVIWSNLTLPFDMSTYHLRPLEHSATVGSVQLGPVLGLGNSRIVPLESDGGGIPRPAIRW